MGLCQKTQLLQGAKTHGAPIESGDSAELEPVIRALAVIAECDQLVDRTVATATTSVLTGLRVEICQPGTVTWTVTLVVPTATGVMLLGGITGTIDSIGTETGNDGVRKKLGQPSLRREQALRALLCEGRSIDEIAADRGIQARSLHLSFPRDLCALGVSKLMVPALLNGSPPQLRAAVAHLLGLTDRQHGWSDEWLEAVRAAYISGRLDRWFKSWQPAVSDERQRLNRLLVDSGGILNLKEATVLHGFPASSLRTFASLSGSHPATVSIFDDRIGRGSGVLRLRVCQCCGSPLSLILRVPESAVFSSALLCENCRTLGVKGSPVFPDFYFDLLSLSEKDQSNSEPEQTDGNNE